MENLNTCILHVEKKKKKNINDLHKLIKSLKCRELLICIIGHKVIIEEAF